MPGFQARFEKFCSVSDIGFTEEKLIWYFKLRHIVYLSISAVSLTSSLNNPSRFLFAIIITFIAIIAAIYPRKSVSFEALFLGALAYPFTRIREVRKISTPKIEVKTNEVAPKAKNREKIVVKLDLNSFKDHSEEIAGESTKKAMEMKKIRIKKI